jgi:hypothetical protein
MPDQDQLEKPASAESGSTNPPEGDGIIRKANGKRFIPHVSPRYLPGATCFPPAPPGVDDVSIAAFGDGKAEKIVHSFRSKEGLQFVVESGYFSDSIDLMESLAFDHSHTLYHWREESDYWKYVIAQAQTRLQQLKDDTAITPSKKVLLDLRSQLDSEPTATIPEAARFLKVSVRTVQRMILRKGESVKVGRLEKLPGKRGVTIKSLLALAASTYAPTAEFDQSEKIMRHLRQ